MTAFIIMAALVSLIILITVHKHKRAMDEYERRRSAQQIRWELVQIRIHRPTHIATGAIHDELSAD